MIKQVSAQIDRFSGIYFQWLHFPPLLEARFESDTSARRSIRLAFEGIFALVLFDLALIADHLVSPLAFHRALILRLGLITPIGILINLRMWRNPGAFFREASLCALITAAVTHIANYGFNMQVAAFRGSMPDVEWTHGNLSSFMLKNGGYLIAVHYLTHPSFPDAVNRDYRNRRPKRYYVPWLSAHLRGIADNRLREKHLGKAPRFTGR